MTRITVTEATGLIGTKLVAALRAPARRLVVYRLLFRLAFALRGLRCLPVQSSSARLRSHARTAASASGE
jgi:hypothetical protein